MSLEKTIKNLHVLAQFNEDNGDLDSASEKRQIAKWLQELKERREKESRQIPQGMTEEACEACINLSKKIIEILPNIVESVIANMPEAIEQYIELKRGDQK